MLRILGLVASKLVFIGGLVVAPAGCFTGAAASGLPCNADLDCGVDDKCIDGFCGGPPAGATTMEPTTDSSSSTSSTGPEPTTGELLCDNPAAQCEPVVMGMPDAQCNANCTLPRCGDDIHNPFAENDGVNPPMGLEQCDDGFQGQQQDSASCDRDCTLVECGDDIHNVEAQEPCDDGNSDDFDGCTASCQVPVLMERFDLLAWTSEPYDLSNYAGNDPEWGDLTDVDTAGWTWSGRDWTSGEIPFRAGAQPQFQYNYAGTTRLVSPVFDMPDVVPPGFSLQLRFRHTMSVEDADCEQDPNRDGDGGIVRLRGARPDELVTPDGGYMTLGMVCNDRGDLSELPNPLRIDYGFAFTGELNGDIVVDLGDFVAAEDVELVFEFGTDCIHCTGIGASPSLWTIDDVIVAAFPIE